MKIRQGTILSTNPVIRDLAVLVHEAEASGLWLYCTEDDKWMTPDEMRSAMKERHFAETIGEWCLADPLKSIEDLSSRHKSLNDEKNRLTGKLASFQKKYAEWIEDEDPGR